MRHCVRAACIFAIILVWLPHSSALIDHVQVVGNPHAHLSKGNLGTCDAELHGGCTSENLVNPLSIIVEPLATQHDTLLKVVTKRYLGFPAPIYHFKQPARLSELELPFKLLLLRNLDTEFLVEVQVPRKQASDSWFPGYSWSIVLCQQCGDTMHLGWKFTNLTEQGGHFYALIVDHSDENNRATAVSTAVDFLSEQLHFGVKAPTWMLALLINQVAVPPSKGARKGRAGPGGKALEAAAKAVKGEVAALEERTRKRRNVLWLNVLAQRAVARRSLSADYTFDMITADPKTYAVNAAGENNPTDECSFTIQLVRGKVSFVMHFVEVLEVDLAKRLVNWQF
ncbi:hypothetical protein CYMTET_19346 [Cymbomonas tetramitiformis]|uniref:Uncharacterized protein n=1 Tax=Cymbomonas tetramitiformis TaxID=36881 RepID=A0AAE0L521_9CHLO|nr:hypothetical protein CYMTET_19346 [Cymbomonas tetramitiformis]